MAWGSWLLSEAVTKQIARPATLEDLKSLLRSLNANGVEYLLIGGYALAAHGYQRATTDIDILFPANTATGQRVKEALMILPDQAAKELEPQWFEEGENIRVADAFVVDIMLNANGQTYGRHAGYRTRPRIVATTQPPKRFRPGTIADRS